MILYMLRMNTQTLRYLLFVSLAIGASILGYGLLRYDVSNKNLEFERQQAVERQKSLQSCEIAAENDYSNYWDIQCPLVGTNSLEAGCNLPRNIAMDIEARREKNLDNCIKLFRP